MEIEVHCYTQQSIEDFAHNHNLKMVVRERGGGHHPNARFYASFEGVEVKEGGVLSGPSGNGATIEEAIKAYAPQISKRVLVYHAAGPDRRVFNSPILFV